MFRNYFKTAFRNLSANKVYSMITVSGLGVGIAVCLIIFIFIRYESSFDSFHKNKARIFRVLTVPEKVDESNKPTSAVPFPLPAAIKNDFADWTSTGIFSLHDIQIMTLTTAGQQDKKFKEKNGVFMVDPAFFSIFDFPWLAGDPGKSLDGPHKVVLSQSTANRLFGDWKTAMGRSMKFQNRDLFTVTGIMADPPSNTAFDLSMVFPYSNASFNQVKDWWSINSDHGCYIMLPANTSISSANRQLMAMSKKYRSIDNKNTQSLQPLADEHFDADSGIYGGRTITPERIRTLWMIAGFILLIACVNFINISTAQAVNRAREVGVRKVLGSNRRQLTIQFLLEALLLVASGVALSVLLTGALLTPVSKMLEMPISLDIFRERSVILFLIAITAVVTLLAGFYPALVLSSFNPITALKTKLAARSNSGITLRRGLVVLQFVIAQALIIGTLLILRQLDYFTHASMGFSKEAVVTIPFPGDSAGLSKLKYLQNKLGEIRSVQQVSFNNTTPVNDGNWWTGFNFDHAPKATEFPSISKFVDPGYLSTYSLQLAAGRNITTSDSIKEFLINETLAKRLGFSNPNDILMKEINVWNGFAVGPIVGVVKDFNTSSLKDSLAPVFMVNVKKRFDAASIKLSGADLPGTMRAIEKVWNTTYPNYVFEYQFLDEKIAGFYKEETNLSLFYKVFASIAIFLSCLGLYGLASFMAAQRLKEVGIRKVLGATAANIVYLFSKEFVLLIGIAFLISAPIAWYFVHQWVQHYVFRIPLSVWVFVAGGSLALLIALATVSFQAFRAAAVNPVKNLRTE